MSGGVWLGLELGLFGVTVTLLGLANRPNWAIYLGVVIVLHYLLDH